MKEKAVVLAGKTSVGTLASLIEHAQFVLTNDTGPSHISIALKTPSVILFQKENLGKWGPLQNHYHKTVILNQTRITDRVIENALSLPQFKLRKEKERGKNRPKA